MIGTGRSQFWAAMQSSIEGKSYSFVGLSGVKEKVQKCLRSEDQEWAQESVGTQGFP